MLRAFRTTFIVAIDEREIDEIRMGRVQLREVQQYLRDALILSFNDEEHRNRIGLTSLEVNIEGLEEVEPGEVEQLYNQTPSDENIVLEQAQSKPLRRRPRKNHE